MARSLSGKNTVSGSALTVQSWNLKRPSATTAVQTAMKISVFNAVPNSPPFSQCKSLATGFETRPGTTVNVELLNTAYSSHLKRLWAFSYCHASSIGSMLPGIINDQQ